MGRARQRIYTPPRHVRPVQRMRSISNVRLIGIGDSCDAVEFLLARHRMNIQVDELRNDFAVTHVTATTHGFEDGSLPTRHTSFYTFIPNQFRRQSRLAEDFGRRFPARYRMTHTCLKALEYVMRSFDTLATAGRSRNIWSSSMLNDPPPRIVLPPLLYPVMKQVYIRLLTSSFSNIADRILLQPIGHTSMRAIMEYPQPPALTFIVSESIHNSLTPNACAQYVRRRLLTATATPAPPTSSATTVNNTVPAAPVSGS